MTGIADTLFDMIPQALSGFRPFPIKPSNGNAGRCVAFYRAATRRILSR
jgi:hypothetical protein